MPSDLEKTLGLAQAGFYLLPLTPEGKTPIVKHWKEESTKDIATIESWFKGRAPNIGIDCEKSGLCVIDVDCKAGKLGKESFQKLKEQNTFDKTIVVHTPSGGFHLYYKGEGVRSSQNRLGSGIDIRAEGGYVVAPGSTIDGIPYTMDRDASAAIACLPDWVAPLLAEKKSRPRQTNKVLSEDAPADISWAISFLKKHEPAVEGDGGDIHTYKTFCQLKESGISMQTAIDLVDEHWNHLCSPPWDITELEKKAESAWRSAINATGELSPEVEFDKISYHNIETPKQVLNGKLLYRAQHLDETLIPNRKWVFGSLAIRKNVSIIVAPGGTGKSTLALAIGLSKTTGHRLMGMDPKGVGRVAIYNNEDNLEEMNRREAAARKYYKIDRKELCDRDGSRLFLSSGEHHMLKIIKRAKNGELKQEDVDPLIEELVQHKIDMIIVDPLAETHGAKENDNEEMIVVGSAYRHIAQMANCSVVLIHHTRKLQGASTEGHSGNMDSMRGASSLSGLARIIVTFDGMDKKQAKQFHIPEDQRWRYVSLQHAKANLSPGDANSLWFEKVSEHINVTDSDPDGESVGVLKPVSFGELRSHATENNMELINSISLFVQDGPMQVSELSRQITSTIPFFLDKNPSALTKSINRIFDASDVYPLENVNLVRSPIGTNKGHIITMVDKAPLAIDIDDLL